MRRKAINVEGLGKRYRVGERERYVALRDVLARVVASPFRRNNHGRTRDYVWALRNISLDISEGEIVGLIGRNGAGKTTLLKILSRITCPTEGFAEISGRVGSLLEVGTGFHPELTGRENVFLSGAILGMSKREIDHKFDAIVHFGDVEKFIDTPLKHFSTGMQMRLAFAVAAHLETEILFVDEVLAVGDTEFQKKCLGKMREVSQSGRTIVFVSHQMNQIRRLCERVIMIDHGVIQADGKTGEVVNAYEMAMASASTTDSCAPVTDFVHWEISTPKCTGSRSNILETFGAVEFRFSWQVGELVRNGALGIVLRNSESQIVWATIQSNLDLNPGQQSCSIMVPFFPLLPGAYYWTFGLYDGHRWVDYGQCFPDLRVETPVYMHPHDHYKGSFNIPYEFNLEAPR